MFPMHPISTLWNHQKALRFSDVFREQRKGALWINLFKSKSAIGYGNPNILIDITSFKLCMLFGFSHEMFCWEQNCLHFNFCLGSLLNHFALWDQSFSMYTKFSKYLLFLTPWYVHVRYVYVIVCNSTLI